MASRKPQRPTATSRYPPRPAEDAPEVVDPRWLLKALGATILAALVCAYLAVCLLVYQGGWQLLLHPVAKVDATPSVAFEPVRFDAASTGTPRLTGWWIPAISPTPTTPTILYLHGADGSLSKTVRELELLHRAPVNVFAFDYRGYGQSAKPHPTEARMAEDAAAALDYLVSTRHIPASTIVPLGEGLGAVFAATLARDHTDLPAFIIDNPDPVAFSRAIDSSKAHLLPMSLLVQEHFDLATPLTASHKPKLLIADTPFGWESRRLQANQALFRSVPDPKMTVSFQNPHAEDAYVQSLTRFLDEYVPSH
jgi:pimeloyl-ACP methyl ester carboxylesterase